jgi:hypothetical protein
MCKKWVYLVSFVLVLLAVPLATHAQVENLMHTDPSFEDEIIINSPGWASWTTFGTGGSVEIDTTDFIDGAKSLRVNQTSGQFNVIAAAILMTPGDRYTCSFWAKADAPRPISLRFQSMNNSGFVSGDFDLTTEWAEYTLTEDAPNPNNNVKLQFITNDALGISYWLDFVSVYEGQYVAGIEPSGLSQVQAAAPDPADGATDVQRGSVLSWIAGEFASPTNGHVVYFGENFSDVNDAVDGLAQDDNTFDLGRLDFGKTYFWRVDEVNAAPDQTVFKGDVWRFEAEPYSILIPGADMAVTASSVSNETTEPIRTIDGSGLSIDPVDNVEKHSNDVKDVMWMSALGDSSAWLMYEFDGAQKFDRLLIWNSNHATEPAIGWSIKEVDIQISMDGMTWQSMPDVGPITRGSGLVPIAAHTIDMGLVVARFVKINILSNWGGFLPQYAVAEVQFYTLPTQPRDPMPESGSMDVHPNTVVSWRAGREADHHTVSVSTDMNALADGSAPSVSSTINSIDLNSLDLHLDTTYYWRVDEVNETESPSVWPGSVWSLSTSDALVVDDFERYNNLSPDRPFQTWLDGMGYSADEFFPVEYGGNGTDAGIGHDIWSLSSPHYDGDIMETDRTLPGSSRSMPLYYSNTGGAASQTERVFTVPQDWTVGGVKTLSIAFRGQAGNTGTLYAEINDTQIPYDGAPENMALAAWQVWNIDLTAVNTSLENVAKLVIGVAGNGAEGMVLIDDIRLYARAGETLTPVDPGTANLAAYYPLDGDYLDASGNNRHGEVPADSATVFFLDSVMGQAIDLSVGDAYVQIPGYPGIVADRSDPANPVQRPFTVTCWVNTTTAAGALVTWGSSVGTPVGGQYQSLRIEGGSLRAEHGDGNYRGATPVADGEWHHIALSVAEGANLQVPQNQLFVDAQEDTFRAGGSNNVYNITADADVSIGRRASHGDRFFTGSIDEVRIYDRALSAAEIAWIAGRTGLIHKPL